MLEMFNKISLWMERTKRPRIYVCSHRNSSATEAVDIYPQLDHTDIRLLDVALSPVLKCSGDKNELYKALDKLVQKKQGKIDRFKVYNNRFNQKSLQFHAHFYQDGKIQYIRRVIRFS